MTIGSRVFNGSSDYLEHGSALVTSANDPWTFAVWVKPGATGITHTAFSIATAGSGNNLFRMDIATANIMRFRARTTGSSDNLSTNTVSSGTWYLLVAVVNSDTDRRAYLDNQRANSTTSRNITAPTRTNIGCSGEGSRTNFWDGKIALPTIWNVALSDAEVASLVSGAYPTTIQAANVIHHWAFDGSSPELDSVGSASMTVSGATYDGADGPPVSPPVSTQTIVTAAPVASSVVYQPAVAATATIVTDAPLASSVVYEPSVSASATIVTAAPVASSTVYNPTVTASAQIVTAAPVASSVVYQPTVQATALIETAAPVASSEVFQPSVTTSNAIVTEAPVASSVVYEPTVIQAGAVQTITTAVPIPSSTVFAPSVTHKIIDRGIGNPGPSYYEEIPYFRGEKKRKRKKEELEQIWMRRERERQEEESFLVFLTEVIND